MQVHARWLELRTYGLQRCFDVHRNRLGDNARVLGERQCGRETLHARRELRLRVGLCRFSNRRCR
ncbi:hypothetical protein HanIR_Chr08g0344531 [Helianthus annuus]|nr:hypothetical protein HanIR_Chr08g0344531 [Helianthus annuus]